MTPIDGQPVLTASAMRAAEQTAIAGGETVDTLMARAGEAVAAAVRRLAAGAEVLVLCGPGNNGGDGYVAAATLKRAGHRVRVAATSEPRSEAATRARAQWSGSVEPLASADPASVVVDALFGTGGSRPLGVLAGPLARLIRGAGLSVAVDLPSGVGADDGASADVIPPVDLTLALGAAKPGHLLLPGAARAHAVRLLDIGVPAASDTMVLPPPRLRLPGPDAHKYSRGLVAVVAGAMPGAGALAATAAAHGGAGYVLLLGSATDRLPHAIVRRRYSSDALDDRRIGALVVGPGLGRDEAARAKLEAALASDRPLVLDGDALALLDLDRLATRTAPAVLTPHEGEFAVFGALPGSKIDRARAAARRANAVVVYKGADTVIADPDGRAAVAHRHAAWLSTAGTGDVLAGLLGTLIASGHAPFEAACAAAWLHVDAARRCGPAFLADELAGALCGAVAARL